MEEITNSTETTNELILTHEIRRFLSETAKWATFLAIIGFIGIAFIVILAFFTGALFSAFPNPEYEKLPFAIGPFLTVVYLVMAVVYFFPVLYLYRFGSKMRKSLASKDQEVLTAAFSNLKSQYKFIGIATIAMCILYFVGIIAAVIAGMAAL